MKILFTALAIISATNVYAAVCSRTITFSDGSVLTAAQLNDEFNAAISCINSIDNANISTNASILPSKISSSIAGSGISRDGTSGALSVSVDNSTIEINANALRVKDGGITAAKLASNSVTAAKLDSSVSAAIVPVGSVLPYAGTSAPTGFLLCDGSAVSRTTYATLFALIGTSHGQGNGSTTFNIPDYRGRFIRGVDVPSGTPRDPDSGSRTAMNTGGNTGRNVGSIQGSAFEAHDHGGGSHSHSAGSNPFFIYNTGGFTSLSQYSGVGVAVKYSTSANTASSGTIISSAGSSTETRPVNAYVNFIIKF